MNLPSIDSLLCFSEAARSQSFRAAARSVGLTPAAVGQRIRLLEEQLGEQLFHRTTRKIVLTQAGISFLGHARETIAAAERAVRAARGEMDDAPIELTVGTRHELGMSWVLPMLPTLRAAHPGLSVHLYFGSSADLLIRVRTLEVDCAIGSMRVSDPRIDSVRLHREDYVLVGGTKLLKEIPFRRPEDAGKHTLMDMHAELPLFSYWRDAPQGSSQLNFARLMLMGTTAAIRELVIQGEGIAVLPLYLVAQDLKANRLKRLLPKVELASDYFRLFFRAGDPKRALYTAIAETMLGVPLR